jgi:hypothetical protein
MRTAAGWQEVTINDNSDALLSLLGELAGHFRAHGELSRASAVEGAAAGQPEQLPRRVLALFTRGMGGLRDSPLYSHGEVDHAATGLRYQLADRVFNTAKTMLH